MGKNRKRVNKKKKNKNSLMKNTNYKPPVCKAKSVQN